MPSGIFVSVATFSWIVVFSILLIIPLVHFGYISLVPIAKFLTAAALATIITGRQEIYRVIGQWNDGAPNPSSRSDVITGKGLQFVDADISMEAVRLWTDAELGKFLSQWFTYRLSDHSWIWSANKKSKFIREFGTFVFQATRNEAIATEQLLRAKEEIQNLVAALAKSTERWETISASAPGQTTDQIAKLILLGLQDPGDTGTDPLQAEIAQLRQQLAAAAGPRAPEVPIFSLSFSGNKDEWHKWKRSTILWAAINAVDFSGTASSGLSWFSGLLSGAAQTFIENRSASLAVTYVGNPVAAIRAACTELDLLLLDPDYAAKAFEQFQSTTQGTGDFRSYYLRFMAAVNKCDPSPTPEEQKRVFLAGLRPGLLVRLKIHYLVGGNWPNMSPLAEYSWNLAVLDTVFPVKECVLSACDPAHQGDACKSGELKEDSTCGKEDAKDRPKKDCGCYADMPGHRRQCPRNKETAVTRTRQGDPAHDNHIRIADPRLWGMISDQAHTMKDAGAAWLAWCSARGICPDCWRALHTDNRKYRRFIANNRQ